MWRNGSGWDWSKITPFVTDRIRLELMDVVIDNVMGARDRLAWGESTNGEFTVKTAYGLLTRDVTPKLNLDRFYHSVWRVKVPERIRLFVVGW